MPVLEETRPRQVSDREWADATGDLYPVEQIASEIIAFTGQPELTVWKRIALELESTGTNVVAETCRFGVTPHVFDGAMGRFYHESDGFIYETMIESRHPFRQAKWRQLLDFMEQTSLKPRNETHVLLYGDSVGSDSICLNRLGYDVCYHDFDSYCASFAKFRFGKRNLTIPAFSTISRRKFDYVICLEVAEHVPNPPEFVNEVAGLVDRPDGICLFSESFGWLKAQFPTHLATNLQYAGRTPELFAAAGMSLVWKDYHEKPFAFCANPDRPGLPREQAVPAWRKVARKVKHSLR